MYVVWNLIKKEKTIRISNFIELKIIIKKKILTIKNIEQNSTYFYQYLNKLNLTNIIFSRLNKL